MPLAKQYKCSEKDVIAAIQLNRGKLAMAAESLGITYVTLYNYAKNSQKIRRAIKVAKEMQKDVAEHRLYTAIDNGDVTAIKFYLSTQARDRGYGELHKIHLGQDKDAPPIQTVNANLSFDLNALGLPKEMLEVIYGRMQALKDANPDIVPQDDPPDDEVDE